MNIASLFRLRAIKCFSAVLIGSVLPLAFAPTQAFWLAVLCPAALLFLCLDVTVPQACLIGFSFGLGFFGVGASWIFHSIYIFGNTPLLIAALITLLFVATLALFFVGQCYALQRFFPTTSGVKILLAFPCLWVLFEWLRSWVLSGFPWLLLGHSAVSSPLAGMAPLVGVYGLSFVFTVSAGLLLMACLPRLTCPTHPSNWGKSNLAGFALLFLMAACHLSAYIPWTHPSGPTLRSSIVQGNVPQDLRWNPAHVKAILQHYQSLTEPLLGQSQLIVWPEAAIPLTLQQAYPFYQQWQQAMQSHHSTLVLGLPVLRDQVYYNAAMTLGAKQAFYYKRHLVPFGEYVPFEQQLRGLIGFFNLPMSDMAPGDRHQALLMADKLPLGVFICYEIAYNALVQHDAATAQVLLTISDDDWFGHSLAPWQHLQIAQFQAAASARPLIFASNSGSSAFIDQRGRITASLPPFMAGTVSFDVQPVTGTTLWVYVSDTPYLILMGVLLLLAYALQKKGLKSALYPGSGPMAKRFLKNQPSHHNQGEDHNRTELR